MITNREIAIEMLKNYQLDYLKILYPDNYQSIIDEINDKDSFKTFIADSIDSDKMLTSFEKETIKKNLEEEISNTNFLNTEYESFSEWKILKDIYDKFSSLNPNYNLDDKLYLGTILSDQISAGTTYESDIDALFILFDGELINLALQLSKLIAQSVPLSERVPHIIMPIDFEELKKNIVDNDTIRGRIIGSIYFSLHRKPKQFTRYLLDNELQNTVSAMLIESMEYFIFSHEVGHYLNGDLMPNKNKLPHEEQLKKNWDDEFMADLFGLNKIVELHKSNGNLLSLLGPEIFFNFLILREKYDKRIENSKSHPPATQRLNNYRIFLTNFLDEDEINVLVNYQDLIDHLFKYYEFVVVGFTKFNEEYKKTL